MIPLCVSCDKKPAAIKAFPDEKAPKTIKELRAFEKENECKNNHKTLEFHTFTLDVPCNWNIDTLFGTDTNVDVIRTNLDEVIHWNFGQGFEVNSSENQQDHYTVIDGFNAKITTPKEHGQANTLINFETSNNLPIKDMGLYIIGFKLSRQSDSLLLKAFETIRFKRD